MAFPMHKSHNMHDLFLLQSPHALATTPWPPFCTTLLPQPCWRGLWGGSCGRCGGPLWGASLDDKWPAMAQFLVIVRAHMVRHPVGIHTNGYRHRLRPHCRSACLLRTAAVFPRDGHGLDYLAFAI